MTLSSVGPKRNWQGLALFSFGFRPFFFFGAVWMVAAIGLWLVMLAGALQLPTRFDPVSWHAHVFLFGYLGAVIAGFLLTAVPNWTGRLPIVGWRLVALVALWAAGRIAVLVSQTLPPWVAPVVDLAFPLALASVILREIVAGRNWRNLIVLALLAAFALANALFHYEAWAGEYAAQGIGFRFGLVTVVMMIAVIGGRIIPSFTRNWLVKHGRSARPAAPMQRFDRFVLIYGVPVLALWTLYPSEGVTGACLLAFGILHLVRLMRWQGHHTFTEPLVLVLHAAYAFVPLGAFAMGLDVILGNPDHAGGQHLWMVGAIGGMTVAVMTRASLGHSGRELKADTATIAIYVCVFAAALTRFLTPLLQDLSYVSGMFWLLAFGGFALAYGPMLWAPKRALSDRNHRPR